ncbi:hypothetical protein EJ08DRAFT_695858 [Tothia fuscella]|uniref:DUF6594 domain-containing protein n=1 Tax=Tothia fuscella TaxID=1048955 RepID=A0A9P4NVB1_9PEZI|nr:hypothetical protein EJ08DRAFT_695858 [Tothia fuscella]
MEPDLEKGNAKKAAIAENQNVTSESPPDEISISPPGESEARRPVRGTDSWLSEQVDLSGSQRANVANATTNDQGHKRGGVDRIGDYNLMVYQVMSRLPGEASNRGPKPSDPPLLHSNDPLFRKAGIFKGKRMVEHLHRTNLINARLALYKTYLRLEDPNVSVLNHDDIELQDSLSRYSKAMYQYKESIVTNRIWAKLNVDSELLDVAIRDGAIEILKSECKKIEQVDDAESVEADLDGAPDVQLIATATQQIEKLYQKVVAQNPIHELNRATTGLDPEVEQKNKEIAEEQKRRQKERKRYISRVKMAVFGGLALIIPMLVMTLHSSQLTVLLTTSIFVLTVAMILAATMTEAEPKDVVGATAAYAAVLVVFVGASTTPTSSSSSPQATPPSTNPSGGSSTLSGGRIAGIVIGSIVGMVLIILFIACFCMRGLMQALMAIFGVRRKRKMPTVAHGGPGSLSSDYYTDSYGDYDTSDEEEEELVSQATHPAPVQPSPKGSVQSKRQ